MIGLFADTNGDLGAFGAAHQLLQSKGARRFFFPGGRYSDLDDWILSLEKGAAPYSNQEFLADVTNFLDAKDQVARPPAFGDPTTGSKSLDTSRVREQFVRVPERESVHYNQPGVGRMALDMLGDFLCCLVHDKNDLGREDLLNATVFFHGMGEQPNVVQIGPRFFITPGPSGGAGSRTCALVEMVDRALRFSSFTLEGRAIDSGRILELPRKSRLSLT